jgi:hypothetical protein
MHKRIQVCDSIWLLMLLVHMCSADAVARLPVPRAWVSSFPPFLVLRGGLPLFSFTIVF